MAEQLLTGWFRIIAGKELCVCLCVFVTVSVMVPFVFLNTCLHHVCCMYVPVCRIYHLITFCVVTLHAPYNGILKKHGFATQKDTREYKQNN